jgi:hypothetical protein
MPVTYNPRGVFVEHQVRLKQHINVTEFITIIFPSIRVPRSVHTSVSKLHLLTLIRPQVTRVKCL